MVSIATPREHHLSLSSLPAIVVLVALVKWLVVSCGGIVSVTLVRRAKLDLIVAANSGRVCNCAASGRAHGY